MEKEIRLIKFINENYGIKNFNKPEIILKEFLKTEETLVPKMSPEEKEIINFITDKYNVSVEEIFQKGKGDVYVSEARQLIAFLFMDKLNYTVSKISRFLRRNHSTINHSYKVIANRILLNQLLIPIENI